MDAEEVIEREIKRYTDTVYLFYSLAKFLRENRFVVYIEPTVDFRDSEGEIVKRRPDIVLFEDDCPTAMIVKELNSVYEKYSNPSCEYKTSVFLGLKEKRGWNEVISTLTSHSEGLTWSELQSATNLNPVTLTNRLKEGMSQDQNFFKLL